MIEISKIQEFLEVLWKKKKKKEAVWKTDKGKIPMLNGFPTWKGECDIKSCCVFHMANMNAYAY